MRTLGLSLFIVLFVSLTGFGQVKIGDNPQNIDPSAVLELESTTKALIITRVTTAQMEAIAPSVGALVYNTDLGCVHYYNGAAWVNLCVEGNVAITTEPIVNSLSTIVLTPTADGNNLEVAPNSIRSEQIVDGGVNGVDIQNNSIGPNKLADNSVNRDKLSENAVGLEALDTDEVTLGSLINDAGFITSAEVVSPDPANDITDNGGAFFDQQPLVDAIAGNTAAIAADGDTNANNEIQSLGLNGNLLSITGSNTIDLGVFDNTGTDNQTLALNSNILGISNGNTVNLSAYVNTDNQVLAITGNQLSISGGNVVTIPASNGSDTQIIPGTGIAITGNGTIATPYQITNTFVETDGSITNELITGSILNGSTLTLTEGGNDFDIDLTGLGGGEIPDNELITNAELNGTDLVITEAGTDFTVPLGSLAVGNQDLASVLGIGANAGGNQIKNLLNPTDPQDAATQNYVETRIADILAAGGGDPTDEFIDSFTLNNTELVIIEGLNTVPPLDLDPVFTTDAELAAAITASNQVVVSADLPNSLTPGTDGGALYNDLDGSATNELQNINEVLNIGNDAGGVAITNLGAPVAPQDATTKLYVDTQVLASGQIVVSTDIPNSIVPGIDGGALYNDLDPSPTNEIQAITSSDGSVDITAVGINDFDLSVPASTDDQNLTSAILAGTNLTISIEGGAPAVADLSALATDAELAALNVDDADADPGNEIQTISSPDGSVTVTPVGTNDYELRVAGGSTDDQNLTSAILAGTNLTISIEGGAPAVADLSALATDAELAALNVDDADADPGNEIQTISSPDGSVTVTPVGTNDYELRVAGGSTDDQNLTSAILAGTNLTISIEGGAPAVADLSALATDAELAALNVDDADADPGNEIQTISSPDGSVTVTPVGTNDYELRVAGGSTDDQNLTSAILAGTNLTISIEGGAPAVADLSALATDAELAALNVDDADADPGNEIQTISSPDGSVTVTPVGTNDYELRVAGGSTDDQNLTSAILAGTNLTISIEGGAPAVADLSALATDAELAALNVDDADADPGNEIQTITSTDNSIAILQTGNDFDISIGSVQGSFGGGPSVIVNNTIGQADIGDGAIGPGEIQSNAVSSDEIEDDSIVNVDIAGGAAIDGTKINPDFGAQDIVTTGGLSVGADILLNGNNVVPDYVFQKYFLGSSKLNESYNFSTLEEIEAFIKKYHHLPGIKSAAEVKLEGSWNLSESNLQNLEKIEELYLHTIDQEKQIDRLNKENDEIAKELESLRKELEAIKKLIKKTH